MNTYVQSALLGATTGIRSTAGTFAAKWADSEHIPIASAMALGGEMVADKMPFVPPRTTPGGLVPRVGGAVYAVRSSIEKPSPAAYVIAVGAAIAAAFAATRVRAFVKDRTKVPDVVVGLAEDAVVAGLVYVAMKNATR